ncbi:hypothetical protein [Candidatus Berkiella aquae]|uniref:Uncharacterized protein n=1 Tax=Candidatus Berkiella aquae TaxID=295108 RepID=A0A0Q9YZ72_9GAMM|nr:hypothetical protein [Candidatus Berkiella aquae]MCS5712475.1 hypothetical protein [Candidatus Berkiella aquae]
MPKKPHTKRKQSADVSEESVEKSTSEESQEPTPEAAPANAENRKKLLTQLGHHSKFVRMMGWALGFVGLYFMGATFYALSHSVLLKPVGALIFGTSTSPGIPVAAAQAILPAFMAPYAVYFVVGIPLALWAYQFAFQYLNQHLFEPKVVQKQSNEADNDEAPDNQAENKPKGKKPTNEVENKPKATKAAVQVQDQAKKKAGASNKSDAKKSASAPAADKGHGKVISHAFNQHKRKAQETKQNAAQAKKAEAAKNATTEKNAAPAKRKTANRR